MTHKKNPEIYIWITKPGQGYRLSTRTRTGQENAEADLKLNYPILGEFCNYTKDRPLGINMHYLLSLTGAKPCLSRT